MTFNPDADSHVLLNQGSSNFGTSAELSVDPHPTATQRSFISFDVSSIPSNATIAAADLRLCPTAVNALAVGRVHEVRRVLGVWGETSVSWNIQPTISGNVTDSTLVADGLTCNTFDLAVDVQSWVDGDATNLGWRVGDSVEDLIGAEVTYGSRENLDSALHPTLTVTYTTS